MAENKSYENYYYKDEEAAEKSPHETSSIANKDVAKGTNFSQKIDICF